MKKVNIITIKNKYYSVDNNKEEFWNLRGNNFGEKYWNRFFTHPKITKILIKKKKNKKKMDEFWTKNTEQSFNVKELKDIVLEKETIEKILEYEEKKYELVYKNI
jgi:hypothetical protein